MGAPATIGRAKSGAREARPPDEIHIALERVASTMAFKSAMIRFQASAPNWLTRCV